MATIAMFSAALQHEFNTHVRNMACVPFGPLFRFLVAAGLTVVMVCLIGLYIVYLVFTVIPFDYDGAIFNATMQVVASAVLVVGQTVALFGLLSFLITWLRFSILGPRATYKQLESEP